MVSTQLAFCTTESVVCVCQWSHLFNEVTVCALLSPNRCILLTVFVHTASGWGAFCPHYPVAFYCVLLLDSFVTNLVPVRVWCVDFSKCTYCSHLSEDGVPSQFHFIQFIFRLFMQLYLESSCSHDFPWPRRVLVKVLNQVLEGRLSKADKNIRECCLRLINSHGIACPAPLRILWWSNKMGITKLVAQCNNEF